MHVLTVIAHPNPASFTHAVAGAFVSGARAAGHEPETADLHAEGFDPRWTMEDASGKLTRIIRAEQARIERCDALCLVFPLYWFGMPAMLKGWIDRVWSFGWAYDQVRDPRASLLKPRACTLLIPAGVNPENWQDRGLDTAMEAIWRDGTLGYFGLPDPRIEFLGGADGSDARRQRLLARARAAGQALAPPP